MDKERRGDLKNRLKSNYPILPDQILESFLDQLAELIQSAAPKDLQIILSSGGLDAERDSLRDKYSKIIASKIDVPVLDEKGEAQMAGFFIDIAFDMLKDSEIGFSLKGDA